MWESLGSVCYVGLCISGLYSVTCLAELIKLYYQQAISPSQLLQNFPIYDKKQILVSGPISSIDHTQKQVYKSERIESRFFYAPSNYTTQSQVFFP